MHAGATIAAFVEPRVSFHAENDETNRKPRQGETLDDGRPHGRTRQLPRARAARRARRPLSARALAAARLTADMDAPRVVIYRAVDESGRSHRDLRAAGCDVVVAAPGATREEIEKLAADADVLLGATFPR